MGESPLLRRVLLGALPPLRRSRYYKRGLWSLGGRHSGLERTRQAAEFIRRFLKHPAFDTQAKRMGTVARVHADGLLYWRVAESSPTSAVWQDK